MARATKAALAAPNVAILPTAAPRKVQQNYNRAAALARQQLRERNPWPGEYLFPGQRAAMRQAEILASIEQTPAYLIATAIFATLDDDTRLKVLVSIAPGAAVKRPAHVQAVAAMKASRLSVGEALDLDFALRRLNREER